MEDEATRRVRRSTTLALVLLTPFLVLVVGASWTLVSEAWQKVLVTLIALSTGPLYLLASRPELNNLRMAARVLSLPEGRVRATPGPYLLSLACVYEPPGKGGRTVRIEYLRLGGEGRFNPGFPGFRVTTKWHDAGDFLVEPGFVYSDMPGLFRTLETTRAFIRGSEYCWSDSAEKRLEAALEAPWGIMRSSGDTVQSVQTRILRMAEFMLSIDEAARQETRFAPRWSPRETVWPASQGPFVSGAWCLECQRRVSVFLLDRHEPCPHCGKQPIGTLYRAAFSRHALEQKVARLLSRYPSIAT